MKPKQDKKASSKILRKRSGNDSCSVVYLRLLPEIDLDGIRTSSLRNQLGTAAESLPWGQEIYGSNLGAWCRRVAL